MLAIDVGNTHITVGFFLGAELNKVLRVPTLEILEGAAFFKHVPDALGYSAPGAAISSVRAQVTEMIVREFEAKTGRKPLVADVATPMGITVRYDTLATLGVDRLICAAAAHHLYQEPGRAVIVIDMGTATTIDYVTSDGVFIGGMIAPGLKSAYQGLIAGAPQLPLLDELSVHAIIGSSTAECLRSGITIGHAAMIRGVVEMMAQSTGVLPVTVVTGGLSSLVRGMLPKDYIVDDALILKGLSLIFTLHTKNKC
jgi:type III pantothenate kinase